MIQPHLIPAIVEMEGIDPHDLVRPETYFISESHARGFVWSMFLHRAMKYTETHQ